MASALTRVRYWRTVYKIEPWIRLCICLCPEPSTHMHCLQFPGSNARETFTKWTWPWMSMWSCILLRQAPQLSTGSSIVSHHLHISVKSSRCPCFMSCACHAVTCLWETKNITLAENIQIQPDPCQHSKPRRKAYGALLQLGRSIIKILAIPKAQSSS